MEYSSLPTRCAINNKQTQLKIYTDWANHYLERRATNGINGTITKSISITNSKSNSNSHRCIVDLTTDLQDGVLLIEIVESVTGSKITSTKVCKKPKNSSQMIDNIDACLQYLIQLGVNTDGINANDVFDGNLKSILSLFFNLSRYKQAIKAQQQQQLPNNCHQQQNRNLSTSATPAITPSTAMLSKLPFGNKANAKNSSSNIPIGPKKASVSGGLTSGLGSSIGKAATSQGTHSRSGSPASHSFIPQTPQSSATTNTTTNIPTKGIRAPRPSSTSSIPCPSLSSKSNVILRNKNNASNQQQSMLDKIKLYKSGQQIAANEQNNQQINNKSESTVSKRTSSSSGFSSAKSDSSASLCGIETSVTTTANNKIKPTVTVSKTRTSNYSQNSLVSINTNSNSSNSFNNLNNNQLKKSEEVLNSDNSKTIVNNNNNNNNNRISNPNAKFGSIPVKRLQPPRSRPTSTIIEPSSISTTMASNSQSTSNTSLTTIAKPTAAVKGTSKVFASEENASRISSTIKFDSHSPSQEQTSHTSNSNKLKTTVTTIGQQTQQQSHQTQPQQQSHQTQPQQPVNQKPEPSIAMVSPIMAREQQSKANAKNERIDEEKDSKSLQKQLKQQQQQRQQQLQQPSTSGKNLVKTSDTHKEPKIDDKDKEQQQHDSASSSHGEESASNSDVDSALVNIKPMAPLVRTSQFAFLRSNANSCNNNQVFNGNSCSRFTNYSNIENGYLSDCTLLDSSSRANTYQRCGPMTVAEAGYLSESGVCSPHIRRNQMLATKPDYMSSTHRHYHDDSAANVSALKAANFYHLMNQKHITSNNAHYPSFCLDDSSSLSSDPGMISGTEASGTTTTSSMSSSTGDPIGQYMSKPNAKYVSSKSQSKAKSAIKKTDSSMQTESMSALSSTAVWKRYLHEHHLMMKANNTVAPKAVNGNNEEGTKSLDRLDSRPVNGPNNKKLINTSKIMERHDSYESLKHGINKTNIKHDLSLLSNKRPLSSPSSSRTATSTPPGSGLKQYSSGQRQTHKSKAINSTQTDSTHSDSEYVQQKQQHNNIQQMLANKYSYMTSPLRQRDASSRLSSYADIGGYGGGNDSQTGISHSSMSPWLQRHALALQRNALTEAESMESLNGPLSLDSNYYINRQHSSTSRPNSASVRLRESASASPGLNSSQNRSRDHSSPLMRNGSFRGNKSSEPTSQPTSPTRLHHIYSSGIHESNISSTIGQQRTPTAGSIAQFNPNPKEDDLIHGSSLSLVSTSSMFSATEDKSVHEVRKLRRELDQANEKVSTLTSQLTTNAHMVAAFEQSLSSMTARLQQLSASAELKDCELDRLRNTIENLKKQGLDSRLDSTNSCSFKQTSFGSKFSRQLSAESVSSVSSGADGSASQTKNKKKSKAKISANSSGWLRSSFTKAFKKNKGIVKRDAFSDAEVVGNGGSGNEGDSSSVPNSPLMSSRSFRSDSKPVNNDLNESETVQELKRQLREKEMILTDIRLESLTSAHQLENLKETVNQMRSEMLNLKQDNDRLQRLVSSKSLASSQSSMTSGVGPQNSHTTGSTFSCRINGTVGEDQNSIESLEMEAVTNALLCEGGKLVSVGSGTHIIASLVVTPKTNWDQLDLMIKKCFKDHINRIDSGTGLGLGLDSLACYQVGSEKIQRTILTVKSTSHLGNPEMLPFGYLVNENHICLQFKSASDSLVFDTLIPKSIIHRFIGLLNEHRRIILCGPSGTGKTYLAHKLAEYLAIKRATDGKSPGTPIECCPAGSIATFSVDHKSAKELRAYLSNVAEQCDSEASSLHLPTVIILDNLHHVGSISEVFNGLLNITHTKCPYIIGTMNQTTCTTTNLQLNHNFRWVLCANHMEPVKGFLSRYLKRKLIETEVKMASNNMTPSGELIKIIDWIPKLWSHLNRFLEVHSSSDVTIGPRLFSSCPIDVSGSQVWFTDLWNYSIIPYVIEATREGIQMYGKRTQFVDPTEWVLENYPWTSSTDWTQHLLRIRPEDVNYESNVQTNINGNETLAQNSSDPLLNMLLRLQEAANYSNSSHPNESNNNHNNHNTSSVSIINSGLESTL